MEFRGVCTGRIFGRWGDQERWRRRLGSQCILTASAGSNRISANWDRYLRFDKALWKEALKIMTTV